MGRPSESSGTQSLFGVFNRAGLTHDVDLDLPGIIQLILDLLDDLAGDNHHSVVIDHIGLEHNPHLASGLNGEALFNAVEGGGNLLKLLKTLDVVLNVFAPGAGTGRRNRVGRLYDAGDDGALQMCIRDSFFTSSTT